MKQTESNTGKGKPQRVDMSTFELCLLTRLTGDDVGVAD